MANSLENMGYPWPSFVSHTPLINSNLQNERSIDRCQIPNVGGVNGRQFTIRHKSCELRDRTFWYSLWKTYKRNV